LVPRAPQAGAMAASAAQELRARDVSEAQARNQDSTRSSSSPAHMEEDDEEAGLIWTRDKGSDDGLDSKDNAAPRQAQASDGWIKWAAAATLLVQNSGTNLIMPLAQMTEWNSQSGVINQELGKLVVSAAALVWGGGLPNLAAAARPTPEALKTAVPALLFLVQNNLQYVAAKYLDPTMFAVLYQLKILATALLSVALLQKQIGCIQWVALAVLIAGTVLVTMDHSKPSGGREHDQKDILPGVVAILGSCFLSGMAGVYFEKLLKGSTVTLAARNLQLASYSVVIGLVNFYRAEGSLAHFTDGYTSIVWLSICNNAFGGLIVAVVIKYADNIWKNFANTLAIILTSFVHAVFLGGSLGPGSLLGVLLVVTAVLMYSGVCSPEGLAAFGSRLAAAAPATELPRVRADKIGATRTATL